jgi:NDP-sugar pyrophosphorylase family protein
MSASRVAAAGPAETDVVILAGGLGTRLRGAIGALPKVLAPVAGRPFLDILLDDIARHGFRRVVLLLGYRADAVQAHLAATPRSDLAIETVIETSPLGTAGALRAALPQLHSDPVLVMNGDSFVAFDAAAFLDAFRRSRAPAALVCVAVADTSRYGALEVDADARLVRFLEKRPAGGPGLINAGVYLLGGAFLQALSRGDGASFERDVLERQPPGMLLTYRTNGGFLDIGTPESLALAPSVLGLEPRPSPPD